MQGQQNQETRENSINKQGDSDTSKDSSPVPSLGDHWVSKPKFNQKEKMQSPRGRKTLTLAKRHFFSPLETLCVRPN